MKWLPSIKKKERTCEGCGTGTKNRKSARYTKNVRLGPCTEINDSISQQTPKTKSPDFIIFLKLPLIYHSKFSFHKHYRTIKSV